MLIKKSYRDETILNEYPIQISLPIGNNYITCTLLEDDMKSDAMQLYSMIEILSIVVALDRADLLYGRRKIVAHSKEKDVFLILKKVLWIFGINEGAAEYSFINNSIIDLFLERSKIHSAVEFINILDKTNTVVGTRWYNTFEKYFLDMYEYLNKGTEFHDWKTTNKNIIDSSLTAYEKNTGKKYEGFICIV